VELFHLGLTDLHSIWTRILSEEVLEQLSRLRELPARDFRIPDSLWAHIIYDAALAHHRNVLPQEHLLKALTPLYLGKTASFVLDSQGLTTAESEHLIEGLCRTFEKEKEYLVTRWPQSVEVRDAVSTAPARPERSQP
jgi:glucosylglycerate synthase